MPDFIGNFWIGIKNFFSKIDFRGFIEKIGPGGVYFRYALGVLVAIGVVLVVLVAAILFPGLKNIFIKPSPTPSSQASIPRPPVLPLPTGFQSWDVQYGNGATGPKVKTATVDTLVPPKGATQTSTLIVTNDSPVTRVYAIVYTDNTNKQYDMKLAQGSSTNGTWSGIWPISDSYDYTYHINYFMQSSTGNSDFTLTFR